MSGITGAARPVVTLWETHGSGMAEIAAALAENLDVPLHSGAFSSEDLVGAAARGEDTRSGWYLVQATGRPGKRFRWGHLIDGTRKANAEIAAETTAEIRQLAGDGGVFQGKNATFILQDLPNALHVKLDGPFEKRLSALVARGMSAQEAQDEIRFEDEIRSQMSEELFGWNPLQDDLFDLVVNTTELSFNTCVEVIAAAVRAKVRAETGPNVEAPAANGRPAE